VISFPRRARLAQQQFDRNRPAGLEHILHRSWGREVDLEDGFQSDDDVDSDYNSDDGSESQEYLEEMAISHLQKLPSDAIATLAQFASDAAPTITKCMFVAQPLEEADYHSMPRSNQIQSAPDWLIDEVADTLITNRSLRELCMEDLWTNRQILRFDHELLRRQEQTGRSLSCKLSVLTASSHALASAIRCSALIVSASPSDRLESLARFALTHPAVLAAVHASESTGLRTIAQHLSTLLALLPRRFDLPLTTIHSLSPIAQLFAPHVLRANPIEPSSPQHPFVSAMLQQLRGRVRPVIDATLTMDAGSASGQRVQWPAELIDIVINYL
jgi:hypothetical protein